MFESMLAPLLGEGSDPVAAAWHLKKLSEAAVDHGPELLCDVAERSSSIPLSDPAILGGLLRVMHTSLLKMGWSTVEVLEAQQLLQLAEALPAATPNQFLLQQLLAMGRSASSLHSLVVLLRDRPPHQWMQAAQVISPLMQRSDLPIDAVYPAILELLQYPALASPILDLASHLFRTGKASRHPAAARLPMLNRLLGEVVGRLSRFEEDPRVFGDDVPTVQSTLAEAVALAVSLCDSLALIGDVSSIGKLNQAMELRHRRVQCGAAGALARFGEESGKQRLLELTAEPVARLRAIHYADELGLGDQIDERYRSDASTAEAEMALWLSQPQQMGVPPTRVEVVDSRRLLWPSFDGLIDVHLVRYEYDLGDRGFSNVGVCGPATFSLASDVANLPLDDIYAVYAGWHAEHDDIFAVAAEQFNAAHVRAMDQFERHLERYGYQITKRDLLGFFLDEQAGVFTAIREGTPCVVVTDGLETIEQPVSGRLRPLTPADLLNLYKGRKLLRTFNSSDPDD